MERPLISPWFAVTALAIGLLPLGAVSPLASTLLWAAILCTFLTVISKAAVRPGGGLTTALLPGNKNTGLWAVASLPLLVCFQAVLAVVGPYDTAPASATLSSAVMIVALACFYVLARNSLARSVDLRIFLAGLVIIISLEAAYGVLNLLGGNERLLLYKRWAYFDSATGTLVNRNHFAYLMELGLPLSVAFVSWFAAAPRPRRRETPAETGARQTLLGSMVVLAGLGLVFSRSRMGIVSLVLATVMVSATSAVLTPAHGRRGGGKAGIWLAGVVIVGYAAAIGLDPVLERFFFVEHDFEAGRLPIWQTALAMFYDRPSLGQGWGTFEALAPGERAAPTGAFYSHAHNEYLEVMAESGIVGLGIILWLVFLFGQRLVTTLSRPLSSLQRTTVVALGVAITSILLHSLTDFGLRIPGVALAFVCVVAVFTRVTEQPSLVDGREVLP